MIGDSEIGRKIVKLIPNRRKSDRRKDQRFDLSFKGEPTLIPKKDRRKTEIPPDPPMTLEDLQ